MQFMVIEHIRPGCLDTVYRRFAKQGRLLPSGLEYIDSWLSEDGDRCFQLMQTDDEALFAPWTEAWEDLVEFEIVPLTQTRPGPNPTDKKENP